MTRFSGSLFTDAVERGNVRQETTTRGARRSERKGGRPQNTSRYSLPGHESTDRYASVGLGCGACDRSTQQMLSKRGDWR